jgi:hypothetical protein
MANTQAYFIVHFPAKTSAGAGTNCWVKSFVQNDLAVTNKPEEALKFSQKSNATLMKTQLAKLGAEGGIVQTQYMTAEQKKGIWTFENPKPPEDEEEQPGDVSYGHLTEEVDDRPGYGPPEPEPEVDKDKVAE